MRIEDQTLQILDAVAQGLARNRTSQPLVFAKHARETSASVTHD
jgi:hypothetical protein